MLRVGVAGPVGAGKSTVVRGLAARGFPVLDADRLAHELYAPGTPLAAALIHDFGSQVAAADGGIDRRALGRLVFGDATARARLDAWVHPPLVAEIERRMTALAAGGEPVAVLDAALLLQWSASRLVDVVVGVTAPRAERRRRLVALGLPAAEAERRLDAQVDDAELRRCSEIVIENTGSVEALESKIEALAQNLRRRAGHPAP